MIPYGEETVELYATPEAAARRYYSDHSLFISFPLTIRSQVFLAKYSGQKFDAVGTFQNYDLLKPMWLLSSTIAPAQ
jgi:hypothetical protein